MGLYTEPPFRPEGTLDLPAEQPEQPEQVATLKQARGEAAERDFPRGLGCQEGKETRSPEGTEAESENSGPEDPKHKVGLVGTTVRAPLAKTTEVAPKSDMHSSGSIGHETQARHQSTCTHVTKDPRTQMLDPKHDHGGEPEVELPREDRGAGRGGFPRVGSPKEHMPSGPTIPRTPSRMVAEITTQQGINTGGDIMKAHTPPPVSTPLVQGHPWSYGLRALMRTWEEMQLGRVPALKVQGSRSRGTSAVRDHGNRPQVGKETLAGQRRTTTRVTCKRWIEAWSKGTRKWGHRPLVTSNQPPAPDKAPYQASRATHKMRKSWR